MDGPAPRRGRERNVRWGSPLGPTMSALRALVHFCLLSKLSQLLKDPSFAQLCPQRHSASPPQVPFYGHETF